MAGKKLYPYPVVITLTNDTHRTTVINASCETKALYNAALRLYDNGVTNCKSLRIKQNIALSDSAPRNTKADYNAIYDGLTLCAWEHKETKQRIKLHQYHSLPDS